MPSPFPGMDPYLEHVFHGFHQDLIVEMKRAIVQQVRPNYIADTDVNLYIHELSGDERLVGRPDVYVADRGRTGETRQPLASTSASSSVAPMTSAFFPAVDVVEIPYVRIMDRQRQEVITIIELLSPTNKVKGDDRAAYIAKRNNLRRSRTHFIEIDLLREGEPMPLATQPDADFRIVLSRHEQRPEVTVWPIMLRDKLPTIPVPLKSPDPDVWLDLQSVFTRVYDTSAYADYIYETPLRPPLGEDDMRWAAGLLREAGITPR